MSLTKVSYSMITGSPFNVLDYGAVGNGTTNDTAAIQAAIDAAIANGGGTVYLPAGTYKTTASINITDDVIRLVGAQQYASIILSDHTGNAINIATNNQPYVGNLYIKRNTIGARGSRTGVGIRVYGDIAGASSVQANVEFCRIEGFSKGLDLYGCFLSYFGNLTLKQNDISYYLNNNTNDSITFFACQSNSSVSQHIVGNGVAAECGATFISCEFEDSFKFPAVSVTGGIIFYLQFTNCYLYENNVGSDTGSTFNLFRFDIAGRLAVSGSGVSCGGLADARLVYGRRNASAGNWSITFNQTNIISERGTGPDIDVDFDTTTYPLDLVVVSPTCSYQNANAACYLTTYNNSLYKQRSMFRTDGIRIGWTGQTQFIQGVATGNEFNAGASFNWQNNSIKFSQNSGGAENWLWVDTSGKLRIKASSAPSSDTDGTVVGTQT
jgi:hypothetical protein